ncbi:serine/threonine protein kinase [Myxococcus vastator]|uniref:serine/threonine protein kinase n=1 Tax=Myxococcus vastator TaxID=2709664 RepID=UPI0013D6E18D|nr:serine/threonine-protein kinase [Myxococcus vastator]
MHPRDTAQSAEPTPGDDVGGYLLLGLAGQGGFGKVYLAERGGQRYALKLLPLTGAGLGAWGERELLMLAKVRHPNVVRLLGHWQWPDRTPRFLVIIMEYVDGQRLDVWADLENPSAHAVLLRVRDVARALRALHQHRALHRDVKEANILVRAADGEAVLVDLGVGSHEDVSRATGGSLPPGTRAYLSPEAWCFHLAHRDCPDAHYRSTAADDLYALGVVLYWLLTGRKPFALRMEGDEAAVISQPPEAPRVRNGRVPEALSALCLRLLDKAPGNRPDAGALVEHLDELLTREGADWHAPLCDGHDAHNLTTRPGPDADEEAAWFNEVREELPPRRGQRPWLVRESVTPSPAPAMSLSEDSPSPPWHIHQAPVPSRLPALTPIAHPPTPEERTGRPGVLLGFAALLCMVALTYLGDMKQGPLSDARTGVPPVRKVASPAQPLESNGAAAPHAEVLIPAAIAFPARTEKEPAPVMTQKQDGKPQRPTSHSTSGKALKVAATACTLLGCPGAQVRAPPPPEPCPPGAVEMMAQLGIDVGDKEAWSFGGGNRFLIVREGWTSVRIVGRDFGGIPNGSVASGRLVFGDRVYGRLTQVQMEDTGRTVPVCFELLTTGSKRGLEMEPGDAPGTARVFSVGFLRAVSHFE